MQVKDCVFTALTHTSCYLFVSEASAPAPAAVSVLSSLSASVAAAVVTSMLVAVLRRRTDSGSVIELSLPPSVDARNGICAGANESK